MLKFELYIVMMIPEEFFKVWWNKIIDNEIKLNLVKLILII